MRRAATWLVVRDSAARATRVNSLQLPCRKRARQFSTAPTTALIEQFECCPDAGWTVVAGGKRLSAAAPSVVSAAAPSVAPDGIESAIAEAIVGLDVFDQEAIDDALTAAVAEHEPATALRISSAVSMVSCSVAAAVKGVELYQYVKEHALRQVKLAEPRKPEWQSQLAERIQDEMDAGTYILPIPYMPVLSGGPRADNRLPVLDIFACPTGAVTFAEAHELCAEVMHHLALDLEDIHGQPPQTTAIGSYVPPSEDTLEALTLAFTAIHQADVTSGNTGDILDKVKLAMHTAPNDGMFTGTDDYDLYDLDYKWDEPSEIKGEQLCYFYQQLTEKFPLVALLGPFEGLDWENHSRLTNLCDVQITASDLITGVLEDEPEEGEDIDEDDPLFNPAIAEALESAETKVACNAVLLSVQKVGSVSAAIEACLLADEAGFSVVIDGLDGLEGDADSGSLSFSDFHSNFVVGMGCGQVITEAPTGSSTGQLLPELTRIEQQLAGRGLLPTAATPVW